MHEHQDNVNAEHDIETTFSHWEVGTALKNVSGAGADDEFCAEESQLTVFENASHEGIAFGGHVKTNPENG